MGRRGLICVGAVLAVAVLGVAALVLPRLHTRDADVEGYRGGPGDRQVTVVYRSGPGDRLTHARVVQQDAAHVVVDLLVKVADAGDDMLVRREVVLDLEQPLAGRRVETTEGGAVPALP